MFLAVVVAVLAETIGFHRAKIHQHAHEPGSVASVATDWEILRSLRLAVVVERRQGQGIISVKAIELVGRVSVTAAGAVDIGNEQAFPLLLQFAVGLSFDAHHVVTARVPVLSSFSGHSPTTGLFEIVDGMIEEPVPDRRQPSHSAYQARRIGHSGSRSKLDRKHGTASFSSVSNRRE